jgi:hypothetical protein
VNALEPISAERSARKARSFSGNAGHAARQTIVNNITMSQIADQKASMLMGATFLVFTLAIGQASRSGGHAPLALMVLGAFAFLAAIFAIAVVMPSSRTPLSAEGRDNLMFFGVIGQLDEDIFVERMIDNLSEDETLFRMMMRDVWQNSQVLRNKKYRLLGYAYRTFLAGLIASAAVFVLQFLGVRF